MIVHVFIICLYDLFLVGLKKIHKHIIVISGGENVYILYGFIRFSEMRVFSQVSFLNELFE